MNLLNSGYQGGTFRAYRADGTLGNTSPKLILPQATSRSYLSIQNIGTTTMYMDHGGARATATLTAGVVTGFTILNGGFGYTLPPHVQLKGGGGPTFVALAASGWDGRGQIDNWPVPNGVNTIATPPIFFRPAQAIAVLTAGVITSFTIQDGGAGYVNPPEVLITNDQNDPFGCADPSKSSGSGFILYAGGGYFLNGTFCHTDAIALYASGGSASYAAEYAP
jgi:hypothetical protein